MKKVLIKSTALILSVAILAACASTTIITSVPEGAKLYMDSEFVGTTPYTHTDTKIVGTTTTLKITKEGYNDFNGVLQRNEEVDAGAIVGGIFLLFPFLWTMKYKPAHTYELIPVNK